MMGAGSKTVLTFVLAWGAMSCAREPVEIPRDVMNVQSLQDRSCVELKNMQLATKSKLVDLDLSQQKPLETASSGVILGQVVAPVVGAIEGIRATAQNAEISQEIQQTQSELQAINKVGQNKNCWQVIES